MVITPVSLISCSVNYLLIKLYRFPTSSVYVLLRLMLSMCQWHSIYNHEHLSTNFAGINSGSSYPITVIYFVYAICQKTISFYIMVSWHNHLDTVINKPWWDIMVIVYQIIHIMTTVSFMVLIQQIKMGLWPNSFKNTSTLLWQHTRTLCSANYIFMHVIGWRFSLSWRLYSYWDEF